MIVYRGKNIGHICVITRHFTAQMMSVYLPISEMKDLSQIFLNGTSITCIGSYFLLGLFSRPEVADLNILTTLLGDTFYFTSKIHNTFIQ